MGCIFDTNNIRKFKYFFFLNFRRPKHWTDFVWYNQNHITSIEKSSIPGGFNIGKGSTHVAASRAFIDYVLHNKTAQDILKWMKDIRAPDEHYFSTLNHNPHKGVPGSYTGKIPFFSTNRTHYGN